ncbi:MAG: hypothetical protein ACYC9W_05190 [Candidatus Limnocylindria bacterium]
MIWLQRCGRAAIRAAPMILENEIDPFSGSEGAIRGEPQRAMFLRLGTNDRRVGAMVFGHPFLEPLGVAGVVPGVLGPMRIGMTLAPSLHSSACLVGIPTHPRATVGAPLFRIPIRHACLLSNS